MSRLEYRFVVVEDITTGALGIQKIPGEVRETTVRLQRNVHGANGRTQVPKAWWDSLPQAPEAAVWHFRKQTLDKIDQLQAEIVVQQGLVDALNSNHAKIVARAKAKMTASTVENRDHRNPEKK